MAADDKDDDQTRSFTVLTAGVVVSHYKIISKIGAGGMGKYSTGGLPDIKPFLKSLVEDRKSPLFSRELKL